MFSVGILLFLPIFSLQLTSALNLNESYLLAHLDLLDDFKPPKELVNSCPYYISGFDHEKRPVLIVEIGKCPIRKTVEKGGQELRDMTKYVLQSFRKVQLGPRLFFKEKDLEAEDTVVIFDWEGFSYSQLVHRETTKFILYQFQAFEKVQDQVAYGFFLNANAAALQLFHLARPVLGSVMERVEIFGTQKGTWTPKLLQKIPKNQLPPWYGGEEGDFKPIAVYG